MTTSRAERRQQLDQQIVELGRMQLSKVGAAALSLRAIARELNLVSSAVYRYVDSRDELLTRLVIVAYDELGEAVEASVARASGPPEARLATAMRAFRLWAVDHPAEFALLYGSPVPGYQAPPERTTAPGTRVIAVLLRLLSEAAQAGTLRTSGPPPPGEPLCADLRAIAAEFGAALDEADVLAALGLWTWLLGAVGQEVFDGYGQATFADPGAVFEAQLVRQLAALGR
ncbi:TetR/AcrR family transcriptional regulator [Gordonia caeni]|uniref:TetR/AcrR family transcriptional regulator n=1 Tax=Gordonia caeni TaxID=1007097 RepID=A0ABP7PE42_9ACTN